MGLRSPVIGVANRFHSGLSGLTSLDGALIRWRLPGDADHTSGNKPAAYVASRPSFGGIFRETEAGSTIGVRIWAPRLTLRLKYIDQPMGGFGSRGRAGPLIQEGTVAISQSNDRLIL